MSDSEYDNAAVAAGETSGTNTVDVRSTRSTTTTKVFTIRTPCKATTKKALLCSHGNSGELVGGIQ